MAENEDVVEVDLNEPVDPKKAKKDGSETESPAVIEKKDEKKPADSPSADEVVAKLKKDLEDERNARAAAEKKAADVSKRAQTSEKEVATTQLQLVTNAIATLKAESDRLEEDYAAAFAAQDGKALAKIQRQMSANENKVLQLENGKTAMEEEAKAPPKSREIVVSDDPVEALASQLTPDSADWVRDHPEYVKNPRLNRKMIRAHEDAIDEGHEPDSAEYFAAIEKTLGLRKAAEDDAEEEEALSVASKGSKRDAAPPAAPPDHSGNGSGNRDRATLTKAEAEIAEMNGMTHKQYYDNKMALRKQGRMN